MAVCSVAIFKVSSERQAKTEGEDWVWARGDIVQH